MEHRPQKTWGRTKGRSLAEHLSTSHYALLATIFRAINELEEGDAIAASLRAAAEHLQAAEPLLSAAIREAAQVRSQWLMSAAELAVCYDRTRNRISQILRSMAVEPSLPGGGSRGPLYDFLVVGPLLEARGLRLVNPPPQAA